MESEQLFKKYKNKEHWKNHTEDYPRMFIEFLKKEKFIGTIIDLGSGNGKDVDIFNKAGFKSIGIDISKKDIDESKKRFPDSKFLLKDIEEFDFKENSIDAYYMINVIHYLNKEKAISRILSSLRPKGYLFIHFNLSIIDKDNKLDYKDNEKDILRLVSGFMVISKRIFKRIDKEPIEHTHEILELILQKPF